MKRLALITSHAPSLLSFRAALICALVAKGVKVWALAPNYDEYTRAAVLELGATPIDCPIDRAGMNPFRDLVNTWRMFLLLRRLQPDLTLGYFIKPVVFGSVAALLARVPRRIAMIEGLGFVFTSADTALSFKRRILKIIVLGLYKTSLLCTEKYAAAARIVKQRYSQVRFILLGGLDDNPGSLNEAEVQSWNEEGILEWHGHVSVPFWMAQASVYVLPSYREGMPVSTQEAMAAGRAVITTDVPGCRQTVKHGVNGFLVPPRNSHALAEAMFRFIEQPELIQGMGEASLRIAQKHFDVHKVNARLMAVLLNENNGQGNQ